MDALYGFVGGLLAGAGSILIGLGLLDLLFGFDSATVGPEALVAIGLLFVAVPVGVVIRHRELARELLPEAFSK